MDDTLNSGDLFGDDAFRSREELIEENARLRKELEQNREENDLLAETLSEFYARDPDRGTGERRFAISEEAIDLFEALPEAFSLDEALDEAERAGLESQDAAGLIRVYLGQEMVVQEDEGALFRKTGRKPYF